MNWSTWLYVIGIEGLLDILFMSLLIYTVWIWFQKTRAAFVLTGIMIVAGFYLLSRQFNLFMTSAVFEKFFAVILVALVVIFQEELRHFFEQIAVWGLQRRLIHTKKKIALTRGEVEILVRTLTDLARERVGALIVLRGRDLIVRHLEGGIDLNGEMSEPLLKSLFDPHSMGHDGAMIVEGNHIARFSCHLPLSKNLEKMGKGGTRHAAALGLAELTDALCLVVSEERGTISVARFGDINQIANPEKLTEILEAFYAEIDPHRKTKAWHDSLHRNWKEKILSVLLAAILWFVLVYSTRSVSKAYSIPAISGTVPAPWVVAEVEPKNVEVTLRGLRHVFYFMKKEKILLSLKIQMRKGEQKIRIYPTDIFLPKNVILEDVEPREVKVNLQPVESKG